MPGRAGPLDASSLPPRSARVFEPANALLIVELRHRLMIQSRVARRGCVSASTAGRVLAGARLSDLALAGLEVRSDHEQPDNLLPIGTKSPQPQPSKTASRLSFSAVGCPVGVAMDSFA